jgi:hypothetical protein
VTSFQVQASTVNPSSRTIYGCASGNIQVGDRLQWTSEQGTLVSALVHASGKVRPGVWMGPHVLHVDRRLAAPVPGSAICVQNVPETRNDAPTDELLAAA